MKVYFRPQDVAELLTPLLRHTTLESLFGGDQSAIRAAYTIINDPGQRCELRRVDRIFTAAGRPDLMSLLEEV
jgi:hypothetical protein